MKEEDSNDDIDILNISDIKGESKEQPRNSMFIGIAKFPKSLTKKRLRHHSLPLKAFKISSPGNSKILSSVCDNIFEDELINDNINLSMIKAESNINLKNTFNNEDEKNQKKNKIITKAKTISQPEKKEEENDDDFFLQGPRKHKKSFIFNNILKIRNIKCPRLLEEQWKYEKILLDYNIIDFTSKKK